LKLILLSLFINIIVLGLIFFNSSNKSFIDVWGKSSPSRNILFSVYLSIFIKYMIVSLLLFQIIYKLITPFVVTIKNPIIISNIVIAIFHIITIVFIWKEK
jgi:hypothetical protein